MTAARLWHTARMDDPIRVVEGEIVDAAPVPAQAGAPRPGAPQAGVPPAAPPRSGPPIHALSALLLLVVDNLWNMADWAVLDWVVTIPLSFITVFFPVLLIQKLVRRDSFGKAFAYALLLAVIAAVPTSVTGTPVGMALLAWSGISRLLGRSGER